MSTTLTPVRGHSSGLDNLTLSRKEGWRDYTTAPKRECPEVLTKARIRRLSGTAADLYNERRAQWHNNIGPLKTPQLAALQNDLWDIMDSNDQDGNHAKGAVALDGYPGLGRPPLWKLSRKSSTAAKSAATANSPAAGTNAGRYAGQTSTPPSATSTPIQVIAAALRSN
ncbi:hypothetical protein BH09ACT7_BH09ACT7_09660 [soil metagenome]